MQASAEIHIAVASQEPLITRGAIATLTASGLLAFGVTHAEDAIQRLDEGDVALVDRALLIQELRSSASAAAARGVWLLALQAHIDLAELNAFLAAGVRGCLIRGTAEEELVAAIRRVSAGFRYIPPVLSDAMASHFLAGTQPERGLTARECDALSLAAGGQTTADIAKALFVSPSTAKLHLRKRLSEARGT